MNCGRNENPRCSERTRGNKTLPEKPGGRNGIRKNRLDCTKI
ncbi:hypothetical protein [Roseburia sp. 1XD42-69]|nr:hypothetical protein [Roseburia sp. 1XD42-69]